MKQQSHETNTNKCFICQPKHAKISPLNRIRENKDVLKIAFISHFTFFSKSIQISVLGWSQLKKCFKQLVSYLL